MIPFVCPASEPCFTNVDSMQRESLLQPQKILVLTFPASLTPGAQVCHSCSTRLAPVRQSLKGRGTRGTMDAGEFSTCTKTHCSQRQRPGRRQWLEGWVLAGVVSHQPCRQLAGAVFLTMRPLPWSPASPMSPGAAWHRFNMVSSASVDLMLVTQNPN